MVKGFIFRVICGFLLGVSVFAPGFSGSVVAIIMGIYQDLLRIVSNPFKNLKNNVMFCLPLAVGAGISAVLFVIAFKYLFDTYQRATYMLFVGLIAGNLPIIYGEMKKHKLRLPYYAGGACAFIIAFALSVLAKESVDTAGTQGISTSLMILSLGGFAAGASALVPGMSVSMVLISAGIYDHLINYAEMMLHMDFTYLIPFGFFGICALAGLVFTSNGIKYVFEKTPGLANTAVFGFMAGSLIGIIIQSIKIQDANFNWLQGSGMLIAGLAASMLFVVLGKVLNES